MRQSMCAMAMMAVLTLLTVGAFAENGDFVWVDQMGETNAGDALDIAVDSAGNIYTSGQFRVASDFDPGPGVFNLTPAGGSDIFACKLDSAGNFVWAKSMGGTLNDKGFGIALDSAGNVYISGSFVGTSDFDPGPEIFNLTSAGSYDIFVTKLDSAGNFVWAKAVGGMSGDWGYRMGVDSTGNVYATGNFDGPVDFDPGPGIFYLNATGGENVFVLKLDNGGDFVWARAMGGCNGSGIDIKLDGADNVNIVGRFYGTVDFDPGPGVYNLTTAGGGADSDLFISKLGSTGNFLWAAPISGVSTAESSNGVLIPRMAVDGASNVYVAGAFLGVVDFDPGPGNYNLTSSGAEDAFIAKYDSGGNFVWAGQVGGGTSYDASSSIALDGSGNVYTTGAFSGAVDFDLGPGTFTLTSVDTMDMFACKYDDAGNLVWARAMGGIGIGAGFCIALDSMDNVCIAGDFGGTVDYDPGPDTFELTAAGSYNIFVMKLGADKIPPNAIEIVPSSVGPISEDTVDFTVTFDEPVQGFDDDADVVVNPTGSATNIGAVIAGSGDTYTVTLIGVSGAGTLTLAVNTASDVRDLADNPLATSVTSTPITVNHHVLPVFAWPLGLALLVTGAAALRRRQVSARL